ncbi:MAG TPA: GNVR domain-containing protein, partial [Gemmatimonadaceae bacterium]|nr:GNVR domain-containing protein [Gemmatimonadaceae bacterium]
VEERRIRRQVETASSLYLSLRQQYENARIDEVNTTPVITVVDRAIPPRRREWPRRVPVVLGAALLGLLLGMLVGAAREVGRHWARQNPDDAVLLRGALRRVRAEVRDATLRRSRSATGGDGAGA